VKNEYLQSGSGASDNVERRKVAIGLELTNRPRSLIAVHHWHLTVLQTNIRRVGTMHMTAW